MPGTDWKEVIAPDEEQRFEYFTSVLSGIQAKHKQGRALHAKGNLGAEATFEVLPDVAGDARHGMFDTPKTYPALVRYSNGAPRRSTTRSPTSAASRSRSSASPARRSSPGWRPR